MKPYREYLQKKYLWLLIPLLLLGIFLYHFVAANQAEQELDQTLQEIAEESAAGIQYSSIEVGPFSGTITFDDLNLFVGRHVERSDRITFHFGYLTFLRLRFGGIESALDRDLQAEIRLINGSYRDRERGRRAAADTLRVDYEGNGWDLVQHALYGGPLNRPHRAELFGRNAAWVEDSALTAARTDTLRLHHAIAAGSPNPWTGDAPRLEMRGLTWRPPPSFQEKYGFFIRGFNYPSDAIPFRSLDLVVEREGARRIRFREAELVTEHFRLNVGGYAVAGDSLEDTMLDSLQVSLSDYSEQFRTVLKNLQQLFRFTLPPGTDSLTLPLEGTLGNPAVDLQEEHIPAGDER